MEEIGFVSCNLRVTMFVADMLVFGVAAAKFTNLNVFGVVTENVDVQFMYELCENADILANNTIDIVIGAVDAGLRALAKLTLPFALVSALNSEEKANNSDIFPLLDGKLNVHVLLHILVKLVVIKLD